MSMAAFARSRRVILALCATIALVSACRPTISIGPANTATPTMVAMDEATETSVDTSEMAEATETSETSETAATPSVTEPPAAPATAPPVAQATQCTVSSASINVRRGPGTNFPAITGLRNGQSVTASGRNAAGDWLAIKVPDGREGWVAARLVNCNPAPDALPVVNPAQ